MSTEIRECADARDEGDFTVGEWVARHPGTARIFERHGIDYCCAGRRPLADACGRKGLDTGAIRAELMGLARNAPPTVSVDWGSASLGDLIGNIVASHHGFLRAEEPRLAYLAAKVAHVHGERHPELEELAEAVIGIFGELRAHLETEERDFFPACLKWEAEPGAAPTPELLSGLAGLEEEHAAVGARLERIRALTAGFAPPPDACNSYLALFHGLEQLEADLHEHIHKENNILHARILARSAGSMAGGGKREDRRQRGRLGSALALAFALALAGAPGSWAQHKGQARPGGTDPHAHGDHAAGGPGAAEKPGGLPAIPPALQEEHHALHGALERAVRLQGPVGEAAKALAEALGPHFRREEQIALPPLGALVALAEGRPVAGREAIIRMADSLRQEYPRMLAEHGAIRAATLRLKEEAVKAKLPEYARFAEDLAHHALMEEQVMYPAAILAGQVLRAGK